jgi:hypothetical protein
MTPRKERPHPSTETVEAVAQHLVTDADGHEHLGELRSEQRLAVMEVALSICVTAYPHFRRNVLQAARAGCNDPAVCFYLDWLLDEGAG